MLAELVMPKASVDPTLVHIRHPAEYAKLVSKLGGTPTKIQYHVDLSTHTPSLDFTNAPDFRVLVFASALPNITSLSMVGKLNGKTSKVTLSVPSLTPAQYPVELCGADPTDRANWPSLWLKDVHGDTRYVGWTEWKLAGLHRRLNVSGQPTSPWMANLVRRNETTLLNEGFLNPDELHTIQEANSLMKNPSNVEGKAYAKIRYYIFGETYWNAFTNKVGGTVGSLPQKLAQYEWVDCNDPIAVDWINRHCVTIGGRVYPKTLNFVVPKNEPHLDENSSINNSVDLLFAYQRGEKKFVSPLGGNPETLLKQGVSIAPYFV